MSLRIDLIGKTFGRLAVASHHEYNRWNCTCVCGNTSTVASYDLRSGHIQSCGCLQKERASEAKTTHGASRSPEYVSWCHMIERCENPKARQFKWYGAKGVSVCPQWRASFEAFLADMGPRPGVGYAIDRQDPTGDYEPNNCSWKPKGVGAKSSDIVFEGKTPTQWAAELGLTHSAITYRIRKFSDPRKRKAES